MDIYVPRIPTLAPESLAMLAFGLAVVLRARAFWTIWAAAALVLGLVTDLLRTAVELSVWAYLSAHRAGFLVLCASVLVGSLCVSRQAGARSEADPAPRRRPGA